MKVPEAAVGCAEVTPGTVPTRQAPAGEPAPRKEQRQASVARVAESEQAQRDGDTKPSSYAMMTSCTRSRAASLASSRLT